MIRRPLPLLAVFLAAGILLIYLITEKSTAAETIMSLGPVRLLGAHPGEGKAAALILLFFGVNIFARSADRFENADTCESDSIRFRSAVRRSGALFFAAGILIMSAEAACPLPVCSESAVVSGTAIDVRISDEKVAILIDTGAKGRVLATKYLRSKEAAAADGEAGSETVSEERAFADICGRAVKVSGAMSLPPPAVNPGCFDYRLYLRGRKVLAVMTAENIEAGDVRRPLLRKISAYRETVRKKIEASMSEDGAALFTAMLFGDKSALDDDVYESFRKNGTAHILAVSGLHVGMIYAALAAALRGRRRAGRSVVIFVVLVCYAVMAGCAPSIVRAVIMIGLHIAASLMHRKYDMLSAAAAAALVMLVYEPYSLFSSGFQMSFLAICSIAFLFPIMDRMKPAAGIRKRREALKALVLPSLIIQISTAPYTAYVFNCFSLGGFLANIPVIFLAGLIVPAGIVLMLAVPFSEGLAGAAAGFADLSCNLMKLCNSGFYHEGLTSFDVESPPLFFVIAYYMLLFGLSSEKFTILILRKEKENYAF